jgi:hypothetical protein
MRHRGVKGERALETPTACGFADLGLAGGHRADKDRFDDPLRWNG